MLFNAIIPFAYLISVENREQYKYSELDFRKMTETLPKGVPVEAAEEIVPSTPDASSAVAARSSLLTGVSADWVDTLACAPAFISAGAFETPFSSLTLLDFFLCLSFEPILVNNPGSFTFGSTVAFFRALSAPLNVQVPRG